MNESMEAQLVGEFCLELARDVSPAIQKAALAQQWGSLKIVLHKVKGSSRSVGAMVLSDAAAKLDRMAQEVQDGRLESDWAAAGPMVQAVKDAIAEFLGEAERAGLYAPLPLPFFT